MQAQCRITHQSNVNARGGAVDLVFVETIGAVVLRDARGVAERFTNSEVVIKPVRPAGP